jgi:hypothetical protein
MNDITKDEIVQIVNEELDKRASLDSTGGQEDTIPEEGQEPSSGASARLKMGYDPLDPDMNADRFKNRRRMAWVSLFANLAIVAVILFKLDATLVSNYEGVLGWYFATSSSIILAYIGVSTWSYNTFVKNRGKYGE